MEILLLAIGVVFLSILLVVIYSVFFSEDARGRRRYGADNWARMKTEELRKWEQEEAEELRREEEAEQIRLKQDRTTKPCPICDQPMVKEDVDGVTIDHCPGGHGVWLDQGELEELTELIEEDAESSGSSSGLATGLLLGMAMSSHHD